MHLKVRNEKGEVLKAGCVVVNDQKEILVIDVEGYDHDEFPKGHAEPGESLEHVAVRETKEETGYDVEIVRPLPDVVYHDDKYGDSVRLALFQAKPLTKSGPGEKNIHPQWLSCNEAKKRIYPDLAPIIEKLS